MRDVYLKRAARVSAWLLLAAIVGSVISGWGITRTEIIYRASFGLVDRGVANSIHRGLQIPMAALFLTHLLVNARVRLSSRRAIAMDILFLVVWIVLLSAVVLMEV